MDKIEEVARALCDDTLKRWRSPIAMQREPWREFIPAARAAIEAMREPTDAMKDAACDIGPDTNCGQFDYDNATDIWQVMLDAALNHPTKP